MRFVAFKPAGDLKVGCCCWRALAQHQDVTTIGGVDDRLVFWNDACELGSEDIDDIVAGQLLLALDERTIVLVHDEAAVTHPFVLQEANDAVGVAH